MYATTSRKIARGFGLTLSLSLLGAFCIGTAEAAVDLPPLTVGYFKSANPETVGQKYGLFAPNVRFASVESGVTAFQEILGGSMQLAGGIGSPPLALALLK